MVNAINLYLDTTDCSIKRVEGGSFVVCSFPPVFLQRDCFHRFALTKFMCIFFVNKEGYFGVCDSNSCGGCGSNPVHLLSCKERPWFPLPWPFLVWCCPSSYGFCSDPGISILPCLFSSFFLIYLYSIQVIDFSLLERVCLPGCRFSSHWVDYQWWSMGAWPLSFSAVISYSTQTTWSSATLMMNTFGLLYLCIWI